jgi:UDP-N-acetylglucosamine 2-epimerase (non-hydrolysing)
MAPVVHALRSHDEFNVKVISTGQHKELLLPVLEHFGIVPDISVALMSGGQSLNQLSQRVLGFMDEHLTADPPDYVLVHGDTTTSAMAALAAFHQRVPVAHVEAGLRTGDMAAPFPEEMNRTLVGRIATLHFAPTAQAAANLKREGVPDKNVFVTGNTVIDALYLTCDRLNASSWHPDNTQLTSLGSERPVLLITGHRRENFGQGFANICEAIRQLALAYPDWQLVYPVHLNPNVQEPVNRVLSALDNVHLILPLDYPEFTWLMERSAVILTDSGGIQEEGPALGKPVLVMRDVTERPEAVAAGAVRLVGNSVAGITEAAGHLMSDEVARREMGRVCSPYGDGTASRQITSVFTRILQSRRESMSLSETESIAELDNGISIT